MKKMSLKCVLKSRTGRVIFIFLLSLIYNLSHFKWLSLFSERGGYGGDGDIFSCLGLFMTKGMIPYKEFFDHKGPVTILVNYFIHLFPNNKMSSFFVSVLIVAATLGGIYKILRLFYNRRTVMILLILCLFIFSLFGVGGLTESYCLPFLMWSEYFAVKFFKNHEKMNHNKWYAFFYGITFAICLLTRVTNALVLCCTMFVGFILLISKRKWKNIFANICFFLIGLGISCLPFIIWFLRIDAFEDMLYGTIIYNVMYATAGMETYDIISYLKEIAYFLYLFFAAVFVGIMHVVSSKKERWISYTVIFTGICCIIFQLSGLMYTHYLIAYIPILVVAIGQIRDILECEKIRKLVILMLAACMLLLAFKSVRIYQDAYKGHTSTSAIEFNKETDRIMEQIPEKDRDEIIAYNVDTHFYLASDVKPCFKYFGLQDWQSKANPKMRNELRMFFSSGKAKYIVVPNGGGENVFDDVIYQRYSEIYQTETMKLLKRK